MTPAAPEDVAGLVVAAAGAGTRYGRDRSKLFEPLAGAPVFLHCLRTLTTVVPADRTVLVAPAAELERFREALAALTDGLRVRLVPGGLSRCESVLCGLRALPPEVTLVAVQDAARPLTSADLLRRCLDSTRQHGSGVAAHRVTDTVKVADPTGRVLATPDRASLWAAETPQVFRREPLRQACEKALQQGSLPTDDAAAVEALGLPVYLVESIAPNPKVTHPADLVLADLLLK